MAVEEEKNDGLKGADDDFFVACWEFGFQLAVGQVVLPGQTAAGVFVLVVGLEAGGCGLYDSRNFNSNLGFRLSTSMAIKNFYRGLPG